MDAPALQQHFHDPDAAREYLEKVRWRDDVVCPHCGIVDEAYKLTPKPESESPVRKGVYKCAACRKQFTVTVGTIFERSHVPLHKWLYAIHLLCASKKGMSSLQFQRMLGVTYRTAWFLTHRIREIMAEGTFGSKLDGHVEVDETYVGGKEKGKRGVPGPDSKKTPVLGMVERGGRVRSFPIPRVTLKNIRPFLEEHVHTDSFLNTDDSAIYYMLKPVYPHHESVVHGKEEFVRRMDTGRKITTNTIEGYFGIIKRGVMGIYHHWSRHQMHRYLSEFDFRYNSRRMEDLHRARLVLDRMEGRRLFYRRSRKDGCDRNCLVNR